MYKKKKRKKNTGDIQQQTKTTESQTTDLGQAHAKCGGVK